MTSNIKLRYMLEYRFYPTSEFSYLQKSLQMQYNTVSENTVVSLRRPQIGAEPVFLSPWLMPTPHNALALLLPLPKQLSVQRLWISHRHWR